MARQKTKFASSQIPLYYQLENVMREKITSGVFEAGERIPTEIDLIEQFGVSRITVRQALQSLTDDGLIERHQGRGTFVTGHKSKKRRFSGVIHLTGSLDELIEMGMETPVKVLEMNRVDADPHEAELLQLKTGTPIYRLKRLRINDNRPFGLIINYLPEEIGSRLTVAELSSGASSAHHRIKTGLQSRKRGAGDQSRACRPIRSAASRYTGRHRLIINRENGLHRQAGAGRVRSYAL